MGQAKLRLETQGNRCSQFSRMRLPSLALPGQSPRLQRLEFLHRQLPERRLLVALESASFPEREQHQEREPAVVPAESALATAVAAAQVSVADLESAGVAVSVPAVRRRGAR